jgi:sporulation protein YlmC with PRC-barrel domain
MKKVLVTGALTLALLLAACAPSDTEETPLATDDLLGTPNVIATEPGGDLSTPLGTEMATEVMPTEMATEAATSAATEMATEAQTAVATVAGTEPAATGEATTAPSGETAPSTLLSTELVGSQIVDAAGDPVGDVMELLMDEAGTVQYVVFDASNFLAGTGDADSAATPMATEAATSAATEAATSGVDTTAEPGMATEGVVAVPLTEFEVNFGMETGAEVNEDQVLVYQGTAEDLSTMGGFDVSVLDQDGFLIDTTDTSMDAAFNDLIRVSEFTDFDLRNAEDEDLGEVEDLVVDINEGRVTYGVVDFGGFLGIAEQTTAVPWDLFTVQQEGDTANFLLEVNEDTLQNAPTIDIGAWPSWTERTADNSEWDSDWDIDTRSFWEAAS